MSKRRSPDLPVRLPPSAWDFPPVSSADDHGVVGVGADLEPSTIVGAYRRGLFPMPLGIDGPIGWWSPNPRGVIDLDGLRVSRSLRRSVRRYEVRVDTAFTAVIDACRGVPRDGGWISDDMRNAYVELHRLGWAHCVETWTPDGELVGGLYGLAIGGLFAGESMFHRAVDASKVALVTLVNVLREGGAVLLDVQWATEHLTSLGATTVARSEYINRLERATARDCHPFIDAALNSGRATPMAQG